MSRAFQVVERCVAGLSVTINITMRAGKMPAIAALAYHRASGRNVSMPNQRLSYAENFLYMLGERHHTLTTTYPSLSPQDHALPAVLVLPGTCSPVYFI